MSSLILPWPPTVNTYYRHVGHRVLISARGRDYQIKVLGKVLVNRVQKHEGRLAVSIEAFPPTRRMCDLDNLFKSLLDSLTQARVWDDDSQIDDLSIKRCAVTKGGKVVVNIRSIA